MLELMVSLGQRGWHGVLVVGVSGLLNRWLRGGRAAGECYGNYRSRSKTHRLGETTRY
jgi:hypothetical protein